MPPPFTDMDLLPAIPQDVQCCLSRVYRTVNSTRRLDVDLQNPYTCGQSPNQHQTYTGHGWIDWDLSIPTPPMGGWQCSETNIVPPGARLVADGPIVRRDDSLAIYSSSVKITDSSQSQLFTGWMELYETVGTHSGEPCNPTNHVEGWLVAQGADDPYQALHLAISGTIYSNSTSSDLELVLNGVLVVYPP
jgi:hypothetical protein